MRLIDADTIFEGKLLMIRDVAYDAVHSIIEKINNAPTIDAVPVVRCKDCIFGHKCFNIVNGRLSSWVECINPDGLYRDISCDGYCSVGIKHMSEDGDNNA